MDAAVLVVSNVIGIGIFTTPGYVAALAASPIAMLGVWAVGGALALVGALAYAELAARAPHAGGDYVYLREGFGSFAAFLTGWTSFIAGFSGAIAAGAVGAATYLGAFVPAFADPTPLVSWHAGPLAFTLSPRAGVALAIIAALALVHARGLGPGRLVQNTLTIIKVATLVAFIVAGFVAGHPAVAPLPAAVPPTAWSAWLFALVPVMFSYAGWNAAGYVAEEVRDPVRTVPRALALGTVTAIALFLALNLLYLRVLTHDELVGSIGVGQLAAQRLFGSAAATLFAAAAIAIIFGSLSAMTLAGPRVYFAMARDGAFLRGAGRVHGRYKTPAVAILAQAAWTMVLVLTGTFEQLLTYTGFLIILFSGLAVLSLFVVRRRGGESAFLAWGYPWAPAGFCAVSFAVVANTIVQAPGPALAGLGVLASGVPLFVWMRRRGAASPGRGDAAV